jgi:hypothetical protein
MKANVASFDRVARVIVGIVLILAQHPITVVVGLVLAITGAIGWCPLYRLVGFTTRRDDPGAIA